MSTCGNDKLLFIHVPKTGGGWVSTAMEAAGVDLDRLEEPLHPRLRDIERNGRFTFAFVREPLSWYKSEWAFKQRYPETRNGPDDPLDPFHDLPFEGFLRGVMENRPGFLSRYYKSFVGSRDDEIDFIGDFYYLRDHLVTALNEAGVAFDEDVIRSYPATNESGPAPECPQELYDELIQTERETYLRFFPYMVDL